MVRINVKHEGALILKSILYRLFGTFATIFIAYCFTHEWSVSWGIGGIEFISKIILYYAYEKLWHFGVKAYNYFTRKGECCEK